MSKTDVTERTNVHLNGVISGDGDVCPDKIVEEVILQEYKYKRELWRLQKILRRAISSKDPLPLFNRRHLIILVKRLCKDIDNCTSRLNKAMDKKSLSHVLEMSTQVQHNLLCVAYCDALSEMRDLLRREAENRNDNSICYCSEIHGERALLPLHRLKYLKALSFLPQHHKDSLSSALDGCFEAMSSIHKPDFVNEIDNILDFALIMGPPPTATYENVSSQNDYSEIVQFRKMEEPNDDHVYEEIEMVPLKPAHRTLVDLFIKGNKKHVKKSVFTRSRFTISTTELCT